MENQEVPNKDSSVTGIHERLLTLLTHIPAKTMQDLALGVSTILHITSMDQGQSETLAETHVDGFKVLVTITRE